MQDGVSLQLRKPDRENQSYPSCRIQKGPVIFNENMDLSKEGFCLTQFYENYA